MFTNDLRLRSHLDLTVHLCSKQASDVYDGLFGVANLLKRLTGFGKRNVNLQAFSLSDFYGHSPIQEFLRRQKSVIVLSHNWYPAFMVFTDKISNPTN
ncbi:hypothetical protein [Nostoc sp. DedQUE07]|uniref:hypothetical protein n=1 Tax=Nostoc sp. DedQUE07 TaxID=3075392 RepID=UPI002AD42DD5|nr:hypothetical protein [Nostoc sp. DedQUE07]MDZ8132161.1 hypothetical protein [Nostoc sp. DedQUE07]